MHIWQFGIIDEMYSASKIRDHIDAMSPVQRKVHAWMTGTLDVAYPFVYGALFVGIALKAFKRFGAVLAVPAILVIPVDLIEGAAQVSLLNGGDSLMTLKTIATPLKLGLYFLAMFIALIGLGVIGVRWLRTRKI